MADFDSTSYVQRRNLDDFPAKYCPALEFFFKIDILLKTFWAKSISCFRTYGQKVYPGKWHIPGYPNIASTPPPGGLYLFPEKLNICLKISVGIYTDCEALE